MNHDDPLALTNYVTSACIRRACSSAAQHKLTMISLRARTQALRIEPHAQGCLIHDASEIRGELVL
jgi:hypothetical protein